MSTFAVLPEEPGTVIEVATSVFGHQWERERFVRVDDRTDGKVWQSLYDGQAWDLVAVPEYTVISRPLDEPEKVTA